MKAVLFVIGFITLLNTVIGTAVEANCGCMLGLALSFVYDD
jgi:hypothetical protein